MKSPSVMLAFHNAEERNGLKPGSEATNQLLMVGQNLERLIWSVWAGEWRPVKITVVWSEVVTAYEAVEPNWTQKHVSHPKHLRLCSPCLLCWLDLP